MTHPPARCIFFVFFIVINGDGSGVGVLIVVLAFPLMVTLLLLLVVLLLVVAPTSRDVKILPGSGEGSPCGQEFIDFVTPRLWNLYN